MKKSVLFVLLMFFVAAVFAAITCPKCNYVNQDEDRYCVECGFVIREATPEEKEETAKLNIKTNHSENVSKPAVEKIRFNVDINSEFVSHSADGVLVRITAKNRSTKPLKNLTIKVAAVYSSTRANLDWKGEGVFSLINSFDPSLNPKNTIIREFKIFGRGTFRSENSADCKINATVVNYSFTEEKNN